MLDRTRIILAIIFCFTFLLFMGMCIFKPTTPEGVKRTEKATTREFRFKILKD
jgi:hypothetical protein